MGVAKALEMDVGSRVIEHKMLGREPLSAFLTSA
jgi:hypothetical protein